MSLDGQGLHTAAICLGCHRPLHCSHLAMTQHLLCLRIPEAPCCTRCHSKQQMLKAPPAPISWKADPSQADGSGQETTPPTAPHGPHKPVCSPEAVASLEPLGAPLAVHTLSTKAMQTDAPEEVPTRCHHSVVQDRGPGTRLCSCFWDPQLQACPACGQRSLGH